MIRVSCYQTSNENLPKTFTQLAEKCFYNKLRTLVVTPNNDLITILDKVLWTYSKKHFIPHGTLSDPLPEKQPIYITNKLLNLNEAKALMFVNADESMMLDFLSNTENKSSGVQNFSRVMFLFDNFTKLQSAQIKNILEKSSLTNYALECFNQGVNNEWHKITF
jgi:DNA polymerase-3 subunit chi